MQQKDAPQVRSGSSIEHNMTIGMIHAALHIKMILCQIVRDI
ncbi:MAG: hypothetical protein WAK55_22270 [Xanthobacteraceae bacterium]